MSKPPGRPKSDDPKVSLPIRVRASILADFADRPAARRAIEAMVEARFGPGLRAEIVRALGGAIGEEAPPPNGGCGGSASRPAPTANVMPSSSGGPAIPLFQRKAFNPQPKSGKPKR